VQAKRRESVIALLALAALALGSGDALAGWTVTDLGTWGNISNISASAINNSGQIAGAAVFGSDITRNAALWSNGTVTDLGTPRVTSASGIINDSGLLVGVVVGASVYGGSGSMTYATTWKDGVSTSITPSSTYWDGPLAGADRIIPDAVNNAGQIVGMSVSSFDYNRALIWQNGTVNVLATASGGDAGARGINNLGQIVGHARDGEGYNGVVHAAVWNNATATAQDLGTDGPTYSSYAIDINDSGVIVGEYISFDSGNADVRPVVWTNGVARELPVLTPWRQSQSTSPNAINNAGVIVGSSGYNGNSAVMWKDGEIIDLTSLVAGTGWQLSVASDINDLGQIVGSGYNPQGVSTSFLLTPTPTPIPAALPLFGSALAALGALCRRKAVA